MKKFQYSLTVVLGNMESMTKYFVLLACQLIEIYVLAYMPLYFNVNIIQKTNHQKTVTSYLTSLSLVLFISIAYVGSLKHFVFVFVFVFTFVFIITV